MTTVIEMAESNDHDKNDGDGGSPEDGHSAAHADRAGHELAGGTPPISGRGLRFVLVHELRKRGTLTVAEMVQLLNRYGFNVNGRASKVISDSLRWERARGRVVRLARGVYAYGRTPPSTLRRIKIFARQCHAWVAAVNQGLQPPLTPATPEHRITHWTWVTEDPHRPPWGYLTWLWTT